MQNIHDFKSKIQFLLTDIDDTMTDKGLLSSEAYDALWMLHKNGIKVIPVTGRPAGWCEMIARVWPVAAIVGENGGFYFRYHQQKMIRHFFNNEKERLQNKKKLARVEREILQKVKGCAIASDQFCRMMDLAIDFCEDVPALPKKKVQQIVQIFEKHKAHAKVSSIHVNGWFGDYNKLTQSLHLLKKEFKISASQAKKVCAFIGDSPNDEPMWEYFPHSFSVANIRQFITEIEHKPNYIAPSNGGKGFAEVAHKIISCY